MGLDMYLYKRSYLYTGDWVKEELRQSVSVTKGGNPDPNIKSERIKYVIEEVGYWRKANSIHRWFVDNIQKRKDDCGTYIVHRDQLENLLSVCKTVLEDKLKAEELLPSQSGFFFGGTEYDEWYFKDIEYTIQMIEECLSDESADEFEYTSSW